MTRNHGGARPNTGGARQGSGPTPVDGGRNVQVVVRLSANESAALDRLCARWGVSRSDAVRAAVAAQVEP